MKLIPRGDRVVVLLDPVQEEKHGSIWVPDKHDVPSRFGKVMYCGPEAKQYVPGERIMVGYFSGVVAELPRYGVMGDQLRVLRESEILSAVENEDVMSLELG